MEGCLVANNVAAGLDSVGAGAILRASDCTITDNAEGLFTNGGSLIPRSNNTLEGNSASGAFTGTYSAQ